MFKKNDHQLRLFFLAMFLTFISTTGEAFSDTIILKSGKRIEGRILEKTDDFIKIDWNGTELYYEKAYIQDVLLGDSEQATGAADVDIAAPSWFRSGLELASKGDFENAEKEFNRGLTEVNGALTILDKLKQGAISKEYAALVFEGALALMMGEFEKAIIPLKKAWEFYPENPDINYNLGAAYYCLKDYQTSLAYLLTVTKLQPQDAEAFELISKIYLITGQAHKAKENLLLAKERLPEGPSSGTGQEIEKAIRDISPETLP